MRNVLFCVVTSVLFSSMVGMADENAPAVVETEGKAIKVFLMGIQDGVVATESQKLRTPKSYAKEEILLLKFMHQKFDMAAVETAFRNADYAKVIATLEPVIAPYEDYMSVTNNLQEACEVLMKAYCRNGNDQRAGQFSRELVQIDDASLKLNATVCGALSAAGLGDFETAEALLEQIKDPAAALYVKASIERAKGMTREAMQTAVEVIAQYANNMDWLPSSEFLCAELYLEMGRTNSAAVVARQSQKMYVGTNIEKEAEALRSKLELELSRVDSK